MNKKVLANYENLCVGLGLKVDEVGGAMYGVVDGFTVSAVALDSRYPYLLTISIAARTEGTPVTAAQLKEVNKSCAGMASLKCEQQYVFRAVVKSHNKQDKLAENFKDTLQTLIAFLKNSGYVNCCQASGKIGETTVCYINQAYLLLCDEVYSQNAQTINMNQEFKAQKKENVLAGAAGALIGALIGGASIVLISQLGYVAAISGVLMGILTVKGYELMGGKLSSKGIIISVVMMLIVPCLADMVDWAIIIAREFEVDFFLAFQNVIPVLEENNMMGDYAGNLAKLYLYTAIGAVPMIYQTMKNQKTAGRVYQLGK